MLRSVLRPAGRALLAFTTASALLGAATAARAEVDPDTAVPPVCANPDMAFWNAHAGDYQNNLTGSSPSDLRLHVNYLQGVGALQNCAFQSQQQSYQVCTGPGGGLPCHAEYTFVPGIPVTAAPDTIDAAGGDGQTVTLKATGATTGYMDQAARAGWGSCFPGATYQPGLCDPSLFRFGPGEFVNAGGQMLYRFRDETGAFRGPWTLSYGRLSPGFKLEHSSPLTVCDKSAEECQYQVTFQRDPLNRPVVTRDVQVLLLLTVHEGVYPNDQSVDAAVPMLFLQSAGGDASGQGNGGPASAGPATSGGGPGTPVANPPAPVPAAARPQPPVLPGAARIALAGGAPRLAALARAGALKATLPVATGGVKATAVLTVAAGAARTLGLKVPKGARAVRIGTGTATASGPGSLALSIRLTPAARAALRHAARRRRSVKTTLALTLSGPGGTAGPVLKPVTIRP